MTRSTPASLPLKGQVTRSTTLKWTIGLLDYWTIGLLDFKYKKTNIYVATPGSDYVDFYHGALDYVQSPSRMRADSTAIPPPPTTTTTTPGSG